LNFYRNCKKILCVGRGERGKRERERDIERETEGGRQRERLM
jgi:hypothetical protein